MSGDDEDSVKTPVVKVSDLEDRLGEETERLLKLYDAYELQEKEMVNLKAEIEVLEKEIVEREIEKESFETLLSEKDNRLRDLELRATKSSKQVDFLEPELQTMEEKYSREKDRLGKVFGIAEELDNDLRLAVVEMKSRDDWYVDHMGLFEDLNKAIKIRYEMIERSVEAERQSQHMQRAITDRMEELIESRAAEMTIDEAEAVTSAGAVVEEDETPEEETVEEETAEEEAEESPDEEEETVEEEAEESPDEEEESSEEETAEEEAEESPDEEEESAEPREVKEATSWGDDVDPWQEHDEK
jgi:cobalamin biosynthesis protein CobT